MLHTPSRAHYRDLLVVRASVIGLFSEHVRNVPKISTFRRRSFFTADQAAENRRLQFLQEITGVLGYISRPLLYNNAAGPISSSRDHAAPRFHPLLSFLRPLLLHLASALSLPYNFLVDHLHSLLEILCLRRSLLRFLSRIERLGGPGDVGSSSDSGSPPRERERG